MSKKTLYEGPDISYHNGAVDIKRIRDAGCRRVGLRAGYGKNNVDQRYISNALACYNLGVDVLLYWFSYAYTTDMAAAEAGYAIAQAAKYWQSCPIAFDFEYDSVNYARKNSVSVTKALATDMAIAFLQRVKTAGYIPVIYTNRDYLRNYFDMDRLTAALGTVYVWYARYVNSLPASEAEIPDIWQYTSTGRLAGVTGNVDMNCFYTDFTDAVKADREDKCNLNIQSFQIAANVAGYLDAEGKLLVEDGIDGPRTQYVRRLITLKAKKSGSKYLVGSSGPLVKWWQRRCNEILEHSQKVDGLFGNASRSETLMLQRRLSLKADGIAGYNSIQAVFYN
ncbi:MAG: hypothetical protein HFH85_15170 [Lachnospiraceae bacterium]|jgi:lysozyme|nr:hypothetical protein [Lachnospiraceae bacterium]